MVALVLALAAAACSSSGATDPSAAPGSEPTSSSTAAGATSDTSVVLTNPPAGDPDGEAPATSVLASGDVVPTGFTAVSVVVTGPDGSERRLCMLLADSEVERQRGLMDVTATDLGGYDGMVFTFPSDTQTGFWMRNTDLALSIAYLDADGALVSTADMEPCPDDVDRCPTYPADGPYRRAIEVPQGALAGLGIVEGATVAVTGDC